MPKLEYTITKICDQFFVMDSEDEFVGTFESEAAAKAEIAREQLDDAIWGRTKELVRHAVHTLMAEFNHSWFGIKTIVRREASEKRKREREGVPSFS